MRKFVRTMILVVVALSAGLLVACGGDDGGTEPNPSRIQATVRADGAGISGVTVRLYASGSTTAADQGTTNGSGQVVFDDLSAGGYDVEVVVPGSLELDAGESGLKPVTVAAGATSTVSFDLVSDGDGGGGQAQQVDLLAASFSPAALTISPGTTVTWRNANAIAHTVTPQGHSEWSEVTLSQSGETFSHTFDNEGSFPYECTFHAGMTGTVTVEN